MDCKHITVTSPLLPNLANFTAELRKIWDSKLITNNGIYHKKLEAALAEYLGVPYVSLFTNGTLPLITALQALRITGEVITTPYSFVATTHALWWNGIKPVFVDIDPKTGNIDPDKIEAAITPKTTAIMPVHVYGKPCETERIQEIADRYGLKVIYDAAHAFGVRVNGESILNAGDTPCEHAPWGITQVRAGGVAVAPQNTRDCSPLGNRLVAYWPYDDMTDYRFYPGKRYFTLRQDTACSGAFKFGISSDYCWGGYYIDGQFFKKSFSFNGNPYDYPDYGCNFESYTDYKMLELEALGPVVTIQPGQCAELAEKWEIMPANGEGLDPKSEAFADMIAAL